LIKTATVTSGYAAELEALKGRTFEFSPGYNILFGPNGCGKSSLLNIIGAYCMIGYDTGGYSRTACMGMKFCEGPAPQMFAKLAPSSCEAEVDWDGTPTFKYDSSAIDPTHAGAFMGSADMSFDGLTTDNEHISIIMNRPSQGQISLRKINIAHQMLGNPPDIFSKKEKFRKESVEARALAYWETLSKAGPATILFDEPDRSIELKLQMGLFYHMIPKLALTHQIIVATHNPVVALSPPPGANLIDMTTAAKGEAEWAIFDRIIANARAKETPSMFERATLLYFDWLMGKVVKKPDEVADPDAV
jgi:predicted ATPase